MKGTAMETVEILLAALTDRDNRTACGAMRALADISAASDAVYPHFFALSDLLDHKNSYVRNRALLLLAANARWDAAHRFDRVIGRYLAHVTDEKPITARQCIQSLPTIVKHLPHLYDQVASALHAVDCTRYADSMQPLLERDILAALAKMAAARGD